MACKLTKSLNSIVCAYAVAGASKLYLANWYPPITGSTSVANFISYTKDTDGLITAIKLPPEEAFFEIKGSAGTVSFTDALVEGGNGAKYRQHTVNAVVNQFDVDVLQEADAMSLGQFIAVVIDSAGVPRLFGRTNSVEAPAGGFDYNSGAAEADAMGWTVILQGPSSELSQILSASTIITPIYETPEVEP